MADPMSKSECVYCRSRSSQESIGSGGRTRPFLPCNRRLALGLLPATGRWDRSALAAPTRAETDRELYK